MKDTKVIFFSILLAVFIYFGAMALVNSGPVSVFEMFTQGLTSANTGWTGLGSTITSSTIDFTEPRYNTVSGRRDYILNHDKFALQVAVVGGLGTASITWKYQLSNDNSTWLTPTSATNIGSTSSASGPGSDGKDIYAFTPEPSRYLRITGVNSSVAQTCNAAAWLIIK